MNTIKITLQSKNLTLEKAWKLITEIEKYPQKVKYVKKVEIYGEGVGSKWDDTTTILLIPLKMRHTITSWDKNKEYSFNIPLYFGGYMKQKYILSQKDKIVIIEGLITYDLGNNFLNKTIGAILSRRLKTMVLSSFEKTEKKL